MDGTKIAMGLATVGIGSMGLFLAGGLVLFPGELTIDEVVVTTADRDVLWRDIGPLRQWAKWSPWRAERDPTLSVEYAGPSEGYGARMTWSSESSGAGTLRVTGVEVGAEQVWEVILAGGALTFEEAIRLVAHRDEHEIAFRNRVDVIRHVPAIVPMPVGIEPNRTDHRTVER